MIYCVVATSQTSTKHIALTSMQTREHRNVGIYLAPALLRSRAYDIVVARVELICRESCPELSGKIVVLAEREVIRQVNQAPGCCSI